MTTYHKIDSIFKRDTKGKFTSEYSCPEFEYLKDLLWEGTEKIDGTNVRLYKNGDIKGRTDNAQFTPRTFAMLQRYSEVVKGSGLPDDTVIYGEGYGAGIQKGGTYLQDSQDFVLFDVKICGNYQPRSVAEDVAGKLNFRIAPVLGQMTLVEWIGSIKANDFINSRLHPQSLNEGVVLRPLVDLRTRDGKRIITKLKFKDFK